MYIYYIKLCTINYNDPQSKIIQSEMLTTIRSSTYILLHINNLL